MVKRIVFWRVLYKHVRLPGFSAEHTEILQHDVYGKYDAAVMRFIVSQFKFPADFQLFLCFESKSCVSGGIVYNYSVREILLSWLMQETKL